MKPDEDSVLSAYLDDQLEPDPRREVEAGLVDDPSLVAHLAGLEAVHRAVAGLARPEAPCRLASAVLARVSASESARSRRPYYWVATAASLAFGCLLTLRSGLIPPRAPAAVADLRATGARPAADPAAIGGPARPEEGPAAPEPAREVAVAAPLGPVDDPDAEARLRLVRMLDGPGLGRIVVAGDPEAAGLVDDLLRNSVRKEPGYGRLAVAPGLALDPSHPGGAEVFVARMDDGERHEFLRKLRESGAGATEEPSPDPTLGTQLAELGGITLGTGHKGAGLKPPPPDAQIAIHHRESKDILLPGAVGPFRPDPLEGAPIVHQDPNRPDDLLDEPEPDPKRARPKRPTGPTPVVIWVGEDRAGR